MKIGDKVTFTVTQRKGNGSIRISSKQGKIINIIGNTGRAIVMYRNGRTTPVLLSELRPLGEMSALTEAFLNMDKG